MKVSLLHKLSYVDILECSQIRYISQLLLIFQTLLIILIYVYLYMYLQVSLSANNVFLPSRLQVHRTHK